MGNSVELGKYPYAMRKKIGNFFLEDCNPGHTFFIL